MKSWRFLIALGLFLGVAAGGALLFRSPSVPVSGTPVLVASAYPIAYFAQAIAGNEIAVETITPLGVEPHDYEPTVGERVRLERADAFVFVGGGFDPWAEKFVRSHEDMGMIARSLLPSAPNVSAAISEEQLLHASDEHAEEDSPVGEAYDPHIWLDPIRSKVIVEELAQIMSTLDPLHEALFAERSQALTERLNTLHRTYDQGLSVCATRSVIVSHNAFGYLAERYQLEMIPIAGLSPEAEATPGTIAEVVARARAANVRAVFFETIADPRIAETIAREIGGTTKVLNPVENLLPEEKQNNADYFTLMEQNLANLREALSCS